MASAVYPIFGESQITGGTSGSAPTIVSGYSYTVPARPMNLIGYCAFGPNIYEFKLHNTSWESPDPGVYTTGAEGAGTYPRITWFSPSYIKPNSVFTPTTITTTTEDVNVILYLEDIGKQVDALDANAHRRSERMIFNLPQPGRWRALRNTHTQVTADVFETMTGVTWDNSYLSSDCDYYVISCFGHSLTANALRALRLRSVAWPQDIAPLFPGRSDTVNYHQLENAYRIFYKHPGSETLYIESYNSSAEAEKAYCILWEHRLRR